MSAIVFPLFTRPNLSSQSHPLFSIHFPLDLKRETFRCFPSRATPIMDPNESMAFAIRACNRTGLRQVITRVFNILGLKTHKATMEFKGDFFTKKFYNNKKCTAFASTFPSEKILGDNSFMLRLGS